MHSNNPQIVWAMGTDFAERDQMPPLAHAGRHIYLSRDGGRIFEVITHTTDGFPTTAGLTMFPDPVDEQALYVEATACDPAYGTDLVSLRADGTQTIYAHDIDEIGVIASSPHDPSRLLIGVSNEDKSSLLGCWER